MVSPAHRRNEPATRTELIDPALRGRGWLHEQGMIKCEVSAGTIAIIAGKARRRAQGRADYTLRVLAGGAGQPVAVALVEAKDEGLHPASGMQQGRGASDAKGADGAHHAGRGIHPVPNVYSVASPDLNQRFRTGRMPRPAQWKSGRASRP